MKIIYNYIDLEQLVVPKANLSDSELSNSYTALTFMIKCSDVFD